MKKEKLCLEIAEDNYGTYYRVVDANNVVQTGEQGMNLIEVAAFAGIDVSGLE